MFFLCCVNMLPLKALVVLMGQVLNYRDCREQEREVENSNENKREIRKLDDN